MFFDTFISPLKKWRQNGKVIIEYFKQNNFVKARNRYRFLMQFHIKIHIMLQ